MMGKTKNPKLFAPGDIKKFHAGLSAKQPGKGAGDGAGAKTHSGLPGFNRGSVGSTLDLGDGMKEVTRSTRPVLAGPKTSNAAMKVASKLGLIKRPGKAVK